MSRNVFHDSITSAAVQPCLAIDCNSELVERITETAPNFFAWLRDSAETLLCPVCLLTPGKVQSSSNLGPKPTYSRCSVSSNNRHRKRHPPKKGMPRHSHEGHPWACFGPPDCCQKLFRAVEATPRAVDPSVCSCAASGAVAGFALLTFRSSRAPPQMPKHTIHFSTPLVRIACFPCQVPLGAALLGLGEGGISIVLGRFTGSGERV